MSATTTRDLTRKQATQFLTWYGYMPKDVEQVMDVADQIDQFYNWHKLGLHVAVMLVSASDRKTRKFRIMIDTTGVEVG
jgi:hypothetical protein